MVTPPGHGHFWISFLPVDCYLPFDFDVDGPLGTVLIQLQLGLPFVILLLAPVTWVACARSVWRHRRRWAWASGVVCGGILLGVLTFAAWLSVSRRQAPAAVEERISRLQQAGDPTSIEELERFYCLPQGVADRTDQWRSLLDEPWIRKIDRRQSDPGVFQVNCRAELSWYRGWHTPHRVDIQRLRDLAVSGGYVRSGIELSPPTA